MDRTNEQFIGNGEINRLSTKTSEMKYIDYIGQRINLHKEIVKSIIEVIDKHGKEEVNLLEKEEEIGAAWLIRVHDWSNEITEVQVVAVKVENSVLFYKGKENGEVDEDWQTMAVEDDVVSATIDSVYTAVYLTLED